MVSVTERRAAQPIIIEQDSHGVTLSFQALVARIRHKAVLLNRNQPVSNKALQEAVRQQVPSDIHAYKGYGVIRLDVEHGPDNCWDSKLEGAIRKKLRLGPRDRKFQVV